MNETTFDQEAVRLGSDALPHPPAPQSLEESGLSLDLVTPLVLKIVLVTLIVPLAILGLVLFLVLR